MSSTDPVRDKLFAEVILLTAATSPETAAAVALAIIDGASRGYQAVCSEASNREVARALLEALGIEPAEVVTSLTT